MDSRAAWVGLSCLCPYGEGVITSGSQPLILGSNPGRDVTMNKRYCIQIKFHLTSTTWDEPIKFNRDRRFKGYFVGFNQDGDAEYADYADDPDVQIFPTKLIARIALDEYRKVSFCPRVRQLGEEDAQKEWKAQKPKWRVIKI